MREHERDPRDREYMPKPMTDRPMSQPPAGGQPMPPDAMRPENPRDAAAPNDRMGDGMNTELFPPNELNDLRNRWKGIQGGFVDEPRRSVEEADNLVATMIKRLGDSFASARTNLEGQWSRGSDVSTEDLRMALRRYRSFFDRLLAV